jgi:hypothetical protein
MERLKRQIGSALVLLALAPGALGQVELFDGKPTFAEGVDFGYYLWRDGETWHVRWTTKGQMRHFSGHVEAQSGKLRSLKRIDVETERRVLYPGRAPRTVIGPRGRVHTRGGRPPVVATREQDKIEKDGDSRIVFVARTDDLDGFDFKVDEQVRSLRFVLEIDGKPRPQLVEVGKNNQKVPRVPFEVKLN